jgi:hypothetical protein
MHIDEVPQCAVDGCAEHSADENSCWRVIKAYRGRRRVISMKEILAEAKDFFASAEEKLRDGDVLLVRAALETLSVASGGCNRTRW